jgi:Retrotransposon gag protein
MQEVKAYLRLNQDIPSFNLPMKKVAFVLTHMKGPNIARWARDVGEVLDDLQMPQDNILILWTQFCEEFEQQYMDSSRAEQARDELKKLEMKNDDVDAYVAKFKELARNANYNTGHAAIVQIFMEGLNKETLKDILSPPQVTSYTAIKDRAIQSVAAQKTIKYVLNTKYSGGSIQQSNPFNQTYRCPQPFYQHNRQNQGWRQPQYNSSNAPRSMNNQPVPMDLGQTRAPNRGQGRGRWHQANVTNAGPSSRNQTNNACFQYGEIGHYA